MRSLGKYNGFNYIISRRRNYATLTIYSRQGDILFKGIIEENADTFAMNWIDNYIKQQ